MKKLARTITEAINRILKRIGEYGSTEMGSHILHIMNDSLVELVAEHDWKDLQRRVTLTYNEGDFCDPAVTIPLDADRIILLRSTDNETLPLTQVSPTLLEEYKIMYDGLTKPTYYTTYNMEQDALKADAPTPVIEIYSEPDDGAQFYCWYIKLIPEFAAEDVDTVPSLPNNLWRLLQQLTLIHTLQTIEYPQQAFRTEVAMYDRLLKIMMDREQRGGDHANSIRLRTDVSTWNATKRAKI